MKLKSILLSLAVAVAFTMPIDAAQYTVPEGQPPVPGADASIPDTAYQNYRYGEALNANASAIILARKHIYEMLDKQVEENKRSVEQAERWKKAHDKSMDISSHESTVILLHEGDHRAKMTVPIVVTGSFYKDAHQKNEVSSFAVESSVIAALDAINERINSFDVVVIIRGGGATSDLSGFDSLPLAESVANFPLPIITGIGHDRDESVLDMVAFLRVKTPTAAAALLIEHLANTLQHITDAQEEMLHLVQRRMELERVRMVRLAEKVPMLFSLVRTRQEKRFENMALRMQNTITTTLQRQDLRLQRLSMALPTHAERLLTKAAHRLELLQQSVKSHDPSLLLAKGYSITTCGGKVVRNANDVQKGDVIVTQLQKGKVKSVVE